MSLLNKTKGITLLEKQRNDGSLEHEENEIVLSYIQDGSRPVKQIGYFKFSTNWRVIENNVTGIRHYLAMTKV